MKENPWIEKCADVDFQEARIPDDFKPLVEQFIEITKLYCKIVHAIMFPALIYKTHPEKDIEKDA